MILARLLTILLICCIVVYKLTPSMYLLASRGIFNIEDEVKSFWLSQAGVEFPRNLDSIFGTAVVAVTVVLFGAFMMAIYGFFYSLISIINL